jgi:hypothetical protein
MNLKHRKLTTAIALLITVALAQVYVATGLAETILTSGSASSPQAPVMGILSTSDGKAINVNGASAVTGATIPSGASIETPAGVGATIKVAGLGTICIAPNSKVTVEFDRQGTAGTIKVTITDGCAIVSTLKDTTGSIVTPQGVAGQTNPANTGSIDVCSRAGAAPVVNQGAAADAGAGASALDCGAAGAAAITPPVIPAPATIAMLVGGVGGIYLLFRGSNPSPSTP